MKKLLILGSVFAVAALIGLVSFLAGTRNVNVGAFLFPGIVAAVLLIAYFRGSRQG